MQLIPYLHFDGTCEEALTFYRSAFGGPGAHLTRFADSPMREDMPAEQRDRIMHATFDAPGVTFMASDSLDATGEMQRVSLSLSTADVEEGGRLFAALAAGGTVTAPYTRQFWGATFGMCVDRFGVRWMINAG